MHLHMPSVNRDVFRKKFLEATFSLLSKRDSKMSEQVGISIDSACLNRHAAISCFIISPSLDIFQ